MIEITKLTKVYNTKKRRQCVALDDVNITLPSTGLVYVLGKSGSGKSTLLNLIGGLDGISSGSIVVDGNDLSTFKERDFCNYRNMHVGFVFQDYHLIDELTVRENISLALSLEGEEDGNRVDDALRRVELDGYGDRYPTELSGGERQRVAIARAVVKGPRIILADEPTGNLDTNTATAITGLLKELSSECLVLIVSHNVNDARSYADRIIELKRGRVISDKTRNPNFPTAVAVGEKSLLYPTGIALSDEDVRLINENKTLDIVKLNDGFCDTKQTDEACKSIRIENKKPSFKDTLHLSYRFLKSKVAHIALSAFMISAIMVIMAFSQTVIAFNGSEIVVGEMEKISADSLLMNKVLDEQTQKLIEKEYRVEIGEGDVDRFYSDGYGGRIYPVLNVCVPITSYNNTVGIRGAVFGNSPFIKETLGTIVVDEAFFERKIGGVRYAAKLDNPYPEGVIITDYVADCILATCKKYKGCSYEDILGQYLAMGWKYDYVTVNAVLDTGYKERYSELLELVKSGELKNANDLYGNEKFLAMSSEVYSLLGYSYSLDPDYLSKAHQTRRFCSHKKLVINGEMEFVDDSTCIVSLINDNYLNFGGKGVGMSYKDYNRIFGTSYNEDNLDTFNPHSITVTGYNFYDVDNSDPLYTARITIDVLTNSTDTFFINPEKCPEVADMFTKSDIYCYALYFDGTDGIGNALKTASELCYQPQSFAVEGIQTMSRAVEVFIPIFKLIGTVLCVGVVLVLVSFSSRMIRDKMHEIGILKAIGAKNGTVAVMFGLQILLIALLTCVLTTVGYFVFIDLANAVLVQSLMRLAPTRVMLELSFLTFKPAISVQNCILTLLLAALSTVAPLLRVRRIKPVKIIRARE